MKSKKKKKKKKAEEPLDKIHKVDQKMNKTCIILSTLTKDLERNNDKCLYNKCL